ncbi:allantoinase [Ammoniphilus oxalaticus]|uniref:allantoinase n=2 Tax=Ammoniphilus oxalaticus TaxID=66863 RepID=A0A419SM56_9BACL|nr:allantoinase [Ammoniphilus oxalaticus]
MKWDQIIRGGTLVTSQSEFTANIYIKDGKIAAISQELLEGGANEEIDATGYYVLPGLMDTHIHSRDPGPTHKEDFFTSTQAAAAGGITTVFDMPNTQRTINSAESFHAQVDNLTPKAHVDFGLWAICLGDLNNKELQGLNEAGVIGFKFFWGYAINSKTYQLEYNYTPGMPDVIPPLHDGQVYMIFDEVAKTGKVFAIHAENNDLMQSLTENVANSGRTDYDAFLEGRPPLAEKVTVATGISFAEATGARLHILHVSAGDSVDLIEQAQQQGLPITAETCPQYLFLTNEDYERIGPMMKIYPPIKYRADQERIWQGLQDGVLTIVCSDHAPHTIEEKTGDLWSIPAGMAGVETIIPLLLNAVSEGRLTLQQIVALCSENPAKQYGIYPQKGSFVIGTDADFTIVDMNKTGVIDRQKLHSKSKNSGYHGMEIKGYPVATIVRGHTVMKDGEIISAPIGQVVLSPSIKRKD